MNENIANPQTTQVSPFGRGSETAPANHLDLGSKPFRFYFKKYQRMFGLGVVTLFFTNLLDVLNPLALKAAIDSIYNRDQHGLLMSIGIYAALMIGVAAFRYGWRVYFGHFQQDVADDLRNRIYAKLTELGPSFYQKNPVGQLMSLMTNDVNAFRMAIGPGMLILLDGIFLIAMILPLMIMLSWSWTWRTLIFLPFIPFFINRIERMIHERFRVEQDRLSEVSSAAQEIISGIRVIKSYAQEDNQRLTFNRSSKEYEIACNRVAKVDAAFQPVMEFGIASGSVILLYFCTPAVMRGMITLGTFVAFHEYIKKMVWPMSALGMGISNIEQGRASYDRIRELLETQTDIPDYGTHDLVRFESLELKELSFSYPGNPNEVIKRMNCLIRAGETIGVVGPVGCGKTTLMQLICRLYPVSPGQIFINGHSLESLTQASLRRMMSYVPQDAFLFSDTIAENVALGLKDYPGHSKIRDVLKTVNIDQEIDALPEKLGAFLGERGVNLSGGQKQRLTIARALIRRSPVIILDDSLSAVDGKTEKLIVHDLKSALAAREGRGQTTLIVSHRLATLKHADRIFVLNEGTIEAVGSHDELLQNNVTYRQLAHLQSSERLNEALA